MGSVPDRIAREIDNKVGRGTSSSQPSNRSVFVGTERDLIRVSEMDLVVAVDADGLLLGQNYRSSEEALRVLARLGNLVGEGTGKRVMVQTSMPEADLFAALRRAEPLPYLEGILAQRAKEGMPPSSEIVAVEIRGGDPSAETQAELGRLEGATVLGPADSDRGKRWLLTGSLSKTRPGLRSLVQRWRESGLTVRIDADPIDL
jgi:primosomal protein N'